LEVDFDRCLGRIAELTKANVTAHLPSGALDTALIKKHHAPHKAYSRYVGNVPFDELPEPFPSASDFYNTEMGKRISCIFIADFCAFGYISPDPSNTT
jgi:hypothetical protein